MKNIVVVDCISAGINFIWNIVNRSYNSIVLQLKIPENSIEEYEERLNHGYNQIKFDMIYENDTYEETLEVVRKVDSVLFVHGNEDGVILATNC